MDDHTFRLSARTFAIALIALVFPIGSVLTGPESVAAAPPQSVFVVAPNGSGNSCTSHHPCSISAARKLVRDLASAMSRDVVVQLRGGTYRLRSPITLDAADSGRNGHRIVWGSAPGQHPVLNGGIDVGGWKRSGTVWHAQVPHWVRSRQLYINGIRAQRASGPARLLGTMTRTEYGYTISDPAIDSWPDIRDTELVYTGAPGAVVSWEAWTERRCGIASVSGTRLVMKEPCFSEAVHRGVNDQQGIGVPTSIENNRVLLDQQGEWYLDSTQHEVYYRPRPGEDMRHAHAVIPVSEGLLEADGTAANPVHDVTVTGLTFEYDTWMEPSGDGGFPDEQADAYGPSGDLRLPPGAVSFHAARGVVFAGNRLQHLGAQGLVFDNGSQRNRIVGNEIGDTSASGIDLGAVSTPLPQPAEADSHNVVVDNYVHDLPAEYHGGIGIFAGYVSSTTIAHNEIARTPYTGISVGWGWGAPSDLGDNHVTANYVHDVMTSSLLDGGAIYLNGVHAAEPRSSMSGNYVTGDPEPYGELYLDGSVSEYDVTGNVVGNTSTNWVYIQTIAGQIATHNRVTGNYSDTATMSSGWDPSNTVADNHTGLSSWPAPARAIIDRAGLEPRYRGLVSGADHDVVHGRPTVTRCGSGGSAVDGDDSTAWSCRERSAMTVDLGRPVVIDRIDLVTRRDADHPAERENFRLVLSNGLRSHAVATYTTPELPFQAAYAVPVLDRHPYRFLTLEKIGTGPLSAAELRAFGHHD